MGIEEFKNGKELIDKAREFATLKHKGQTRKFTGEPYIVHPESVANTVDGIGGSPEMVAAAWLHDVIEDCGVKYEELVDMFGEKVANLVKELTTPENIDKAKKGQYLLDKMNIMSSDALTIKLVDRLNNVSDFKTASRGFVQRYAPESKFIIDELEGGGRPLTPKQTKLIDAIRKIVEPYVNN